ncbi:hypothetical protein [Rhodococcus jostii]
MNEDDSIAATGHPDDAGHGDHRPQETITTRTVAYRELRKA